MFHNNINPHHNVCSSQHPTSGNKVIGQPGTAVTGVATARSETFGKNFFHKKYNAAS
jgi:hypothetical protein